MTFLPNRNISKDIVEGVDFIFSILPNTNFPRNILVGSYHSPYSVWDKNDILYRYKAMSYEDCYINAYLNFEHLIEKGDLPPTYRPPPNYLMIDIDRSSFQNEEEFEQAVTTTKANIRTFITGITGEYPIIIDSGNGYHLHVPMPGMSTSLENMPEFERFWQQNLDLDNTLLRFLEDKLSNGRADNRHNPSVNSCMFRVPGSINTKARDGGRKDPYVTVIEGFEHINKLIAQKRSQPYLVRARNASRPTTKLLNEFYAYLIQKQIDDKIEASDRKQRRMYQSLDPNSNNNNGGSTIISWIEKLLTVGVEDQRKDLLFWVVAPYLISIKRLDHDKAYEIVEQWLDKCNDVRRLEPNMSGFRMRVNHCLNLCSKALETDKPRFPIKFKTFQEHYPDLYRSLFG